MPSGTKSVTLKAKYIRAWRYLAPSIPNALIYPVLRAVNWLYDHAWLPDRSRGTALAPLASLVALVMENTWIRTKWCRLGLLVEAEMFSYLWDRIWGGSRD